MDDDWLKELLMLPARAHAAAMAAKRKTRIALRKKMGDASMRHLCCDQRPEQFETNRAIGNIPELADLLEATTPNLGYEAWFACRVCGQEWIQCITLDGKIEVPIVMKARAHD